MNTNVDTGNFIQLHSADAVKYSLELAGVGSRSYAFIIDWHIRLLASLLWIVIFAYLVFDVTVFNELTDNESVATARFYIVFIPSIIIYFFYHPVLETLMSGSTPGKRIAGVRLVTLDGHTTGFGSILIRNIFRLIDSLPGAYTVGLIVALFTKNNVRIGDIAAGTILIFEKASSKQSLSQVAKQALNANLSPDDYDLLLELVQRWKQMPKDTSLRLGKNLLLKLGKPVPEDNHVYDHLKKMTKT